MYYNIRYTLFDKPCLPIVPSRREPYLIGRKHHLSKFQVLKYSLPRTHVSGFANYLGSEFIVLNKEVAATGIHMSRRYLDIREKPTFIQRVD